VTSGSVSDDHTPFLQRSVPAIDLIDFTFDEWHTLGDDMSVVSSASLDAVGEAVAQLLLDWPR
jgi:glutaminyl-peptide cyclotransferase